MKKGISLKLLAMTLLLAVAITAVVTASFAWLTLSDNPTASGIQISLNGGSTILVAADRVQTINGVTYHYPDTFSDTLDFSHKSYDYLNGLGGLSPVSTADGIHWFLPTYYSADDEQVQTGSASAGALRPVEDFLADNSLEYANQTADSKTISAGHYVYLDFWVVSPGVNYQLRIASGSDGGSFVIDLPEPIADENSDVGYSLPAKVTSTAATVRIGFLVSSQTVTNESLYYYSQTAGHDDRFDSLRGVYAEQGEMTEHAEDYRFTIYEPNADAHPTDPAKNGTYLVTKPLKSVNGKAEPTNVVANTAVQLTAQWKKAENQTDLLIQQVFRTALYGKKNADEIADGFYTNYLQGQLLPYVETGKFLKNSVSLIGGVSAEYMQTLQKSTATEDVYIVDLEKNVPQRIRMFIWLEGQDADWDPNAAGERFALSIELAGSNQ